MRKGGWGRGLGSGGCVGWTWIGRGLDWVYPVCERQATWDRSWVPRRLIGVVCGRWVVCSCSFPGEVLPGLMVSS